jgi:hypothetical protein
MALLSTKAQDVDATDVIPVAAAGDGSRSA